jgi:DNA primase large subunit
MLRLACSTNVELTQRFISRELDLFKIRFNYLPENLILRFFADNEINLDAVETQERARFRNELSNGNRMTLDQVDSTTFYKLYFTECRELVRMRRVFLRGGYCYVTIKDLIQFLSQKYRLILSTSMNVSQFLCIEISNCLILEATYSNEPT